MRTDSISNVAPAASVGRIANWRARDMLIGDCGVSV
jgi:hypothetical protein